MSEIAKRPVRGDGRESAAVGFAVAAHGGQLYGGLPYVMHLAAVRGVLRDFGIAGDVGVAAWLHDVVEDTAVTVDEVRSGFGDGVAELVWAVTGVGANRQARNADAYAKIGEWPEAVVLKLADRIANVEAGSRGSSLWEMYRREHPAFKAALSVPSGLVGDRETVTRMWARLDEQFDRSRCPRAPTR
ncbi:HD domain-containing protein [Nocardia sp. NPDC055321]